MTLWDYIQQTGTTQQQIADRVGVTQGAIWQIAHGRITPRLPLAVRIEAATDGQVTVRELLSAKARQKINNL